ncbi:MAG: hypothetical protein ACI865_002821 [Flavobacteriaceae bacterium]|jgi:uncharacterized protein
MMSVSNTSGNQFIIPFVGLKIGKHEFELELTDSFFENNEYSLIQKGKVLISLIFEKKESMMIGNYSISGRVTLSCNRCNDDLTANIKGDYKLVYKFDNAESNDESLVIVYPEEFELDIKDSMIELINVSLPARAVHDEGDCNQGMIDLLDEYVVNSEEEFDDELDDEYDDDDEPMREQEPEEVVAEEDSEEEEGDIDPRWNALKKLK